MDEKDELILKRLGESITRSEISKELGLSQSAISMRIKKLREQGIEIPNNSDVDEYILKRLKEGATQVQIAKELKLTPCPISNRIKKMKEQGVEIPNTKKIRNYEIDDIDKIILKKLGEGTTQVQIAKELKLTCGAISNRIKKMKEHGVEIPDTKRIRNYEIDDIDKIILKKLGEGATQTDIANELGVRISTISTRIKKMREKGIEIPEVQLDIIDKKILEGLSNGKTQTELSQEADINYGTIRYRIKKMKKQGIEIPKKPRKADKKKTIKNDKKDKEMNRQLANGIIKLIKTRHATIEQIRIIGDYYGVDIEEILNSLDEQER